MQRRFRELLIIFSAMFLTAQAAAENYLDFAGFIQPEKVDKNLLESDVEDVNMSDDYTTGKNSQNHQKEKEWVNVTMTTGSYILSNGQSYELKCEAAGLPAPEIYWVRGIDSQRQIINLKRRSQLYYSVNNEDMDMSKVVSKHVIHCASELDAGPIHCVAISGRLIETQSAIINIDKRDRSILHEEPCNAAQSPIIKKFRPILLSVQGSTIILPCDASGNPKPRIFWQIESDDGTAIDLRAHTENNSRFEFLRNGGLLIKALQWTDVGSYTCIANSTLGEDRIETFLYPLKPSI